MMDIVNGIVIGEVKIKGELYYNGRKQDTFWCDNQEELMNKSKERIKRFKKELGKVFIHIFPGDLWELRIYN